jgi:nucleotide-binding universal stress UspA family protein
MYHHILVPLDLEEPASWKDAFPVAEAIARCFSARLTICSVVRDVEAIEQGDWLPIAIRDRIFEMQARLSVIAGELSNNFTVEVVVGTGTISGGIVDAVERIDADLVILQSHQPGFIDRLHEANAARVAERAPCSVLIVRTPPNM